MTKKLPLLSRTSAVILPASQQGQSRIKEDNGSLMPVGLFSLRIDCGLIGVNREALVRK